MIRHVVLWQLKDEFTPEMKENIKAEIKRSLEALEGKIPDLCTMQVNINPAPSSTVDLMLDSTFSSAEALRAYAVNPVHVAVADSKVRPFLKSRTCFDFEV